MSAAAEKTCVAETEFCCVKYSSVLLPPLMQRPLHGLIELQEFGPILASCFLSD
jgi:hypothetical protein